MRRRCARRRQVAQPIVVDTGSPANREQWLATVFNLVEPEDVRWVSLSHDDDDHAGNLFAALEACPNATLLTTWYSVGRMVQEPANRSQRLTASKRSAGLVVLGVEQESADADESPPLRI
jgi:flavorubredoxin